MYFLGQTPVEPTGVPIAAEMPAAVVEAVIAAVPSVPALEPIPPPPPPPPPLLPSPPSAPIPGASLPPSVSTGAPAPVDYSMRGGRHGGSGHRRPHGGGWSHPTPVNVFYTDPTPYYYPQPYPIDYREPPSPVYIVRERNGGIPKINWLLVLAVASLLYLLKR